MIFNSELPPQERIPVEFWQYDCLECGITEHRDAEARGMPPMLHCKCGTILFNNGRWNVNKYTNYLEELKDDNSI